MGILGAAGFIGAAIADALLKLGNSVKGNAANEMVDTSSSYTGADAYDSKRFGLLGLGSAKKYQKKVDKRQWERDKGYGHG